MAHSRNDGNAADKDRARTPISLFNKLHTRFNFHKDLTSDSSNHLCPVWYDDFLHPDIHLYLGDSCYCNPPYSRNLIAKFIKKCYEESLSGATVVMLLPSDTSTKAFHTYCMKASEIIFIHPRVHFNNPDGTTMIGSPKFGSMVVVFREEIFDGSPVISSMNWKTLSI